MKATSQMNTGLLLKGLLVILLLPLAVGFLIAAISGSF